MVATANALMAPTRRRFLAATGSAFAALVASGCSTRIAASGGPAADGYGALVPDPAGLLDLPQGFSYRVISSLGDAMNDGGTVPDAADGMGCFDLGGGRIALVRNHELRPGQGAGTTLTSGYGKMPDGTFMPGGTTTRAIVSKAGAGAGASGVSSAKRFERAMQTRPVAIWGNKFTNGKNQKFPGQSRTLCRLPPSLFCLASFCPRLRRCRPSRPSL